jgi:hypothetical protein
VLGQVNNAIAQKVHHKQPAADNPKRAGIDSNDKDINPAIK